MFAAAYPPVSEPGEVLARLREVLENPSAGSRELAEVISSDPETEGLVLRLANSAYYRNPGRVYDVRRAVLLIGFAGIAHAWAVLANPRLS